MNRQTEINKIIELLAILKAQVELSSHLNLTDINIQAENFYRDFLNLVYGYELSNLNVLERNFPAIDLGDVKNKIAIQVTATGAIEKTRKTVESFISNELYNIYDKLIIMNIKEKVNHKEPSLGGSEYQFNTKENIWDMNDILLKIQDGNTEKISRIGQFLEKELNPFYLPGLVNSFILQAKIKTHYQENNTIPLVFFPGAPLSLEDCFIQLGLLEEEEPKAASAKKAYSANEDSLSRDHFLTQHLKLATASKPFMVKDLLLKSKESIKTIYIEGMPGTGKSTLCQYIAYQWARGNDPWKQYEWVFHLPFRHSKLGHSLTEFIAEECLKAIKPFQHEELSYIKKQLELPHGNKVLLLLDGLDELSHDGRNDLWHELTRVPCHKIITSRPGYRSLIAHIRPNTRCIVWGFNDEQIKHYLHHFFTHTGSPEKEAGCFNLLETNRNLWSLAHIPIQCEFLASLWEKLAVTQNLYDLNQTELYALIVELVLRWHANRQGINIEGMLADQGEEEYKPYLIYLESLAFLGMTSKEIVLQSSLIQQAQKIIAPLPQGYRETLKQLGLIKISDTEGRLFLSPTIEFAHLTFQEYFAARFIVRNLQLFYQDEPMLIAWSKLFGFIQENKWDEFYAVMLRFVSGLLAKATDKSLGLGMPRKGHEAKLLPLQFWFDCLIQEPRAEHEIVELAILADGLEEAKLPLIQQKELIISNFKLWIERILKDRNLPNKYQDRLLASLSLNPLLFNYRTEESISLSEALLGWMKDENSDTRSNVLFEIARLSPHLTEAHFASLLSLTKDESFIVRSAAAGAMQGLGMRLSEAHFNSLLDLMRDKEVQVLHSAASSIAELAPHLDKAHFDALLNLMRDVNQEQRLFAAEAIGRLGTNFSKAYLDNLLTLMMDTDYDVRASAVTAISKLGPCLNKAQIDSLLDSLIDLIKYQDLVVSVSAARLIGKLEAFLAEKHLKSLHNLIKEDDDKYVLSFAAIAVEGKLENFLPERCLDRLFVLMRGKNNVLRFYAAWALGELGSYLNQFHFDTLLGLMRDDDCYVRSSAARAVGGLGAHFSLSQDHLNTLVALMKKDTDDDVRFAARQAIRRFDPYFSRDHLEKLLDMMKDKNSNVRAAGAGAVRRLGAYLSQAHLDTLLALMKDENTYVCTSAASTIGQLGIRLSKAHFDSLINLMKENKSAAPYRSEEESKLRYAYTIEVLKGLSEQDTNCLRIYIEELYGKAQAIAPSCVLSSCLSSWPQTTSASRFGIFSSSATPTNPMGIDKEEGVKEEIHPSKKRKTSKL